MGCTSCWLLREGRSGRSTREKGGGGRGCGAGTGEGLGGKSGLKLVAWKIGEGGRKCDRLVLFCDEDLREMEAEAEGKFLW